MKTKILVVDDDKEILNSIEIFLKAEGYSVLKAENGHSALQILNTENISLILLDIMMPDLDGISTLLKLRETQNIPVILISAKSEDSDKILGLSAGADDYVTKPFNPSELMARVKSQLRRYTVLGAKPKDNSKISINGLVIDCDAKSVMRDGESIKLTPIEYRILELLCQNHGKVFSADDIYRRVWKDEFAVSDNTIAVHVRHIREKIEINPKTPQFLKVVWGVGYKID